MVEVREYSRAEMRGATVVVDCAESHEESCDVPWDHGITRALVSRVRVY
jgi:hypothetical protein